MSASQRPAILRRVLITRAPIIVAGLAGLIARPAPGLAESASGFRKGVEFGGQGGDPFDGEYPNEIGIRSGDMVDALVMNGTRHGGAGGKPSDSYTLDTDDYWSEFEVHSGDLVDWIRIRSKKGNEVSGGGRGGTVRRVVSGARILRISGRCKDSLDNVQIEFIENYQPSRVVDNDARAVLDFQPGGREIEEFTDQSVLTAQAFDRITEHSTEFTFNASAEGEYYAKFSTSTGLKTTSSTKEEVKSSTEQALKTGRKVTETVGPDQAAFLVGAINIMQDSAGNYWTYPTRAPNWLKLSTGDYKNLENAYDFTSGVAIQTGLKHKSLNGFQLLVPA